jgi:hypothetical protein
VNTPITHDEAAELARNVFALDALDADEGAGIEITDADRDLAAYVLSVQGVVLAAEAQERAEACRDERGGWEDPVALALWQGACRATEAAVRARRDGPFPDVPPHPDGIVGRFWEHAKPIDSAS